MTDSPAVRIAVAGAGLIGRRHVEEIIASRSARLAAVVESARRGRPVDLPGTGGSRPRLEGSPPT